MVLVSVGLNSSENIKSNKKLTLLIYYTFIVIINTNKQYINSNFIGYYEYLK